MQIKQHPDISIPCPANITTNFDHLEEEKDTQSTSLPTSIAVIDNSQSLSPTIILSPHYSIPEDKAGIYGYDSQTPPTQKRCRQQVVLNTLAQKTDATTKKQLTRAMAIDRTDSSGGTYGYLFVCQLDCFCLFASRSVTLFVFTCLFASSIGGVNLHFSVNESSVDRMSVS